MWFVIPKISIFTYLVVLMIVSLWYYIDVMKKRTYWFVFLKVSEVCGALFLIELASRWYWLIRMDGEPWFTAIVLGTLCALISLIIFVFAGGFCWLVYRLFLKAYSFILSKPVEKVRGWTKRGIERNWKTADKIVDQGLWKTFVDYLR